MAKMKIEALHQRQRVHGLPLRSRLIAHLPRWAPWAARASWLANLRDTLPGAAKVSEAWLGFSAQRALPAWRRDTFLRSMAGPRDEATSANADVVLFVDTFTNYFEPENAHAALNVLRAAGYRVQVARADGADTEPSRPLCCGRTYLAAGLVDKAKHEARRVVAALLPQVERGAAIVGLEPSCLLSLRDEFLVLGLGDAAQRLADNAFLIEEFLAREHHAGRLALPLTALPQTHALLHAHCHQKAFDAVTATKTVLGLVPGLVVELVESSCCGMAAASATTPRTTTCRSGWPSWRCCRPCARRRRTPSSSPTGRAAGSRLPISRAAAPRARRSTSSAYWSARSADRIESRRNGARDHAGMVLVQSSIRAATCAPVTPRTARDCSLPTHIGKQAGPSGSKLL
jgi:hypothetical protein